MDERLQEFLNRMFNGEDAHSDHDCGVDEMLNSRKSLISTMARADDDRAVLKWGVEKLKETALARDRDYKEAELVMQLMLLRKPDMTDNEEQAKHIENHFNAESLRIELLKREVALWNRLLEILETCKGAADSN